MFFDIVELTDVTSDGIITVLLDCLHSHGLSDEWKVYNFSVRIWWCLTASQCLAGGPIRRYSDSVMTWTPVELHQEIMTLKAEVNSKSRCFYKEAVRSKSGCQQSTARQHIGISWGHWSPCVRDTDGVGESTGILLLSSRSTANESYSEGPYHTVPFSFKITHRDTGFVEKYFPQITHALCTLFVGMFVCIFLIFFFIYDR